MIATLSTVVFINYEPKKEIVGNKIIQKGQAISRINKHDIQAYNYTIFLPFPQQNDSIQDDNDLDTDGEALQPVEFQSVYLFHGKFAANNDGSLEVVVTSNQHLAIPSENMPIARPFVHLLGRTQAIPLKMQDTYQLPLQVKPYLSKQQHGTMDVILVHPPTGRFKIALEKTTKLALVHIMGTLMVHRKKLYCDILEYQFVGTKSDENSGSVVPWKKQEPTQTDKQENETHGESAFEKRIQAIHQDMEQSPPDQSTSKRGRPPGSGKGKEKQTKVSDIAINSLSTRKNEQQHANCTANTQQIPTAMEIENADDDSNPTTACEQSNNHSDSDSQTPQQKRKVHNTRKKETSRNI
jgi:hypothetical protein